MSIANTQTETIISAGIIDDNDQTRTRVEHLKELEAIVGNSYPNKYERSKRTDVEDTISNVVNFAPILEIVRELKDNTPTGEKPNQELKESLNAKLKAFGNVRISGRLAVPPRVMGKAAFVHLSDGVCRLQIYVRKQDAKPISNDTGETIDEEGKAWEVFGLLDHGDFIGTEGYLFLTNTGELSVHVETIQFLSKSLMPMPDKMHDIADPEISRRYRYVDLIASSLRNKTDDELEEERQTGVKKLTTREVFERRAKLISGMRRFLDDHDYIEVETPMLTPKATGAAATPFETDHKALGIKLYARIAPELYLKRLTVGGFEKVYELNRNFRNEGLSHKHNPEFTMLEFYCAYMDVNGMMDFAEAMIKKSVRKAVGSLQVKYGGHEIDFEQFERISMKEAIARHWDAKFSKLGSETFEESWLDDSKKLVLLFRFFDWKVEEDIFSSEQMLQEKIDDMWKVTNQRLEEDHIGFDVTEARASISLARLFEIVAESKLIQPTFIIDYPKSISPLSKASPENPQIAERFELFINGMECANGFSELNDPQEQYERFVDQMKERETGDEEAMVLDEDYIRALAYGMPPAAGIGIGIDRLVMLLTNKHSIRDVILFPHLRPEKRDEDRKDEA
ncbi:MAG: lysine--tRNA ligase [Pyrinomonadaceae bacterium]|nr:lysine--tRNA ligase [Pyrinomonadaceae bacterium]